MELFDKLLEVSRAFRIPYEYLGYETIQMGNVNRTYKVNFRLPEGKEKSFLVQNVNTYAFRNPVGLMNNIDSVTEHIRAKKPGQLALHFHHTADRKTYLADGENFWRMTNYVPSVTYNTVTDLNVVRSAGKAFGEFQMDLEDFDLSALVETIPGFHDTRKRYADFRRSVEEDKAGRVSSVREEIDYLLSVEDKACCLTDLYRAGKLPLRVTHNDTKLNNILIDRATHEGICVIDLDTTMPGLSINDFGDSIRFGANHSKEDEKDLGKVNFDIDLFEAYTRGFLEGAQGSLTEAELEYLPWGARLMTLECGIRFLTDYLEGDHYFRIHYPEQNLDRARTQFKLVSDMEAQFDRMAAVVAKYA